MNHPVELLPTARNEAMVIPGGTKLQIHGDSRLQTVDGNSYEPMNVRSFVGLTWAD